MKIPAIILTGAMAASMAIAIACDTPQERVAKQADAELFANEYALANPPELSEEECAKWILPNNLRMEYQNRQGLLRRHANVSKLVEGTTSHYTYWCNAPYDDLLELDKIDALRRP